MAPERRFNLIKTDFEQNEKRVFPRFPVSYLTFRMDDSSHAHEIKDISHSGMQLGLTDEAQRFAEGETIKGHVHWLGEEMHLAGKVMWSTKGRVGIEFIKRAELASQMKSFLAEEKFIRALKPLHRMDYGVELPAKLKYWLRADGPMEIFVWQHRDGELAQFQVLWMESFVEWEDGRGLKTGRIMSKRNVDTPLLDEDEFIFRVDEGLDELKLQRVQGLVRQIPVELLSSEAQDFLLRKLS